VREHDPLLLYDVLWWIVVFPFLGLCRVRVIDRHNLPLHGAVIVAPNHTSFVDHFVVAGVARRRLAFMAKSALFDGRWRFVSRLGAFPVRRGERDEQSMETGRIVLERGGCLVIYCEGTMSRDGQPRERAKAGLGRLALQSHAPVVPVAILDAHHVNRRRFHKITVRFGEPIYPEPATGDPRADSQLAADDVLAEIRSMHAGLAADGHALARSRGATQCGCWPWRR